MQLCEITTCRQQCQLKCKSCSSVYYCSREHQKQHWKIHKEVCEEIAFQNEAKSIHVSSAFPLNPKFLFVSGFMIPFKDCFWRSRLEMSLQANNVDYESMDFERSKFLLKLKSNQFSTIVVINIGSGGIDKPFLHPSIRAELVNWVNGGGKLIIQGEGASILTIFNKWFDKTSWYFRRGSYYGTTHNLQASSFNSFPELLTTSIKLPSIHTVKGCLLSGVDDSDRLYHENQCAVAVSRYGYGRICFIGDVNCDQSTLLIMAAVGTISTIKERNWLARKSFLLMLYGCKIWLREVPESCNIEESSTERWKIFTIVALENRNICRSIISFI
eukprot:gene9416-12682_t